MCQLANKLYVINSLHELNLNSYMKRQSFVQIVNIKPFIEKKTKKIPNRTEVFCCTEPNRTEPKDWRTVTPLVYMRMCHALL